jgi:hypothetical protein
MTAEGLKVGALSRCYPVCIFEEAAPRYHPASSSCSATSSACFASPMSITATVSKSLVTDDVMTVSFDMYSEYFSGTSELHRLIRKFDREVGACDESG